MQNNLTVKKKIDPDPLCTFLLPVSIFVLSMIFCHYLVVCPQVLSSLLFIFTLKLFNESFRYTRSMLLFKILSLFDIILEQHL